MGNSDKINIAVVGLGFGVEFVPIYLHHPNVGQVVICDENEERLKSTAQKFELTDFTTDLDAIFKSNEIDAIHLITGIPAHAAQSVSALCSGKHCACTVPMATSIEEIRSIISAQKSSGKNYMMMETSVYTRQFLRVQEMLSSGEMGRIQFLRGAHYQDMENWPSYWMGLAPMHYATHAISPILAIAQTRATSVRCLGSGKMRDELTRQYNNPYPIETAIFKLEKEELAAEVTRSLFQTAKAYVESFCVLCEDVSFEWGRHEDETPLIYRKNSQSSGRGKRMETQEFTCSDYAHLLPADIARFTQRGVYDESNPHLSFLQGGGHHGSHPHMVNEFVMSIIEKRKPYIDAITAANWTAPGICAHESAINGGVEVEIPDFSIL